MQKLQVCTYVVSCVVYGCNGYIHFTNCTYVFYGSVHHREGVTFTDYIFRASPAWQAALEDIANTVSKS